MSQWLEKKRMVFLPLFFSASLTFEHFMKPKPFSLRGKPTDERKVESGHLLQVFLAQMQDGFETWTKLDFLRIAVGYLPSECVGVQCVLTHAAPRDGSHPSTRPPVTLASWCSCFFAAPPTRNRVAILCKQQDIAEMMGCNFQDRIIKDTVASTLLYGIICSGWSQPQAVRTWSNPRETPTWQWTETFCQQPAQLYNYTTLWVHHRGSGSSSPSPKPQTIVAPTVVHETLDLDQPRHTAPQNLISGTYVRW